MKVVKEETIVRKCLGCPYCNSIYEGKGSHDNVCTKTIRRTKKRLSIRTIRDWKIIPTWCPLEEE